MEGVSFPRVNMEQALAERNHRAKALQRVELKAVEIRGSVDAVDGIDNILPVFFEQLTAHCDPPLFLLLQSNFTLVQS